MLFNINLSTHAKELTETLIDDEYTNSIIDVLEANGDISKEIILSTEIVYLQSCRSPISPLSTNINNETIDAIQITSEDEYGIHQLLVIPFIEDETGITNVTRSNTATSTDFEYSDIIYVLVKVTYYYFSAYETNYSGPFYRPTLVRCMWKNGTGTCSVSSMQTSFVNAGFICNLTDGSHDGTIYQKISEVNVSNPTQGITYVGNNIYMDSTTGMSMYFNGIETYSYAYTTITFTCNGKTQTINLSAATFSDSGLA